MSILFWIGAPMFLDIMSTVLSLRSGAVRVYISARRGPVRRSGEITQNHQLSSCSNPKESALSPHARFLGVEEKTGPSQVPHVSFLPIHLDPSGSPSICMPQFRTHTERGTPAGTRRGTRGPGLPRPARYRRRPLRSASNQCLHLPREPLKTPRTSKQLVYLSKPTCCSMLLVFFLAHDACFSYYFGSPPLG